jgi:replicative DNA helicase
LFALDDRQICLFLRHLWATDGSMTLQGGRTAKASVQYSTTSPAVARDVQALLLRLGVRGRVSTVKECSGRTSHVVRVSGSGQVRFLEFVGSNGERGVASRPIRQFLIDRYPNTNVDTIPREIWDYIRHKVMPERGVTARELAERIGMQYCGSTLYEHGVSRECMGRVASALPDPLLRDLASSDVLWDEVTEITPLGEQPVFDATVPDTHNFLANGLVVHNSLEQDADVVCFIYRDEIYNPESDQRGTAEIIVAKHRNGPTGSTRLAFLDHLTKFANMARD